MRRLASRQAHEVVDLGRVAARRHEMTTMTASANTARATIATRQSSMRRSSAIMDGKDDEDKPGPSPSEIVLKGGGAVAAATAGIALGGAVGAVVGAFLGSVAPDAVTKLLALLRAREERVARAYLNNLLNDDSDSSEGARERAEKLASSEAGARVIADHMRKLASVVDEAILPALAALGREYTTASKPIDRFFRSATSLLTALSADEALAVRAIFEAGTADNRSDPFVIALSAGKGRFGAPGEGLVSIEWLVPTEGPRIPVECTPVTLGLLDELRRSGIASVGYGGYYGVSSGPNIAVVSKETALRMLTHLKWLR